MRTDVKRIRRLELYRQVWKNSIHQLSNEYGLSDVGFAKICKRHNIPRPPRGYWARRTAGQSPPQTPLPDPDKDEIITIQAGSANQSNTDKYPEIQARIDEVRNSGTIQVPKVLRNPHPLVARSSEILELCSPDRYGILESSDNQCLDIKVSPDSLKRTLRIMDTLIKELEARGAHFEHDQRGIHAIIVGEQLQFGINEIIESEKTQPDDDQLRGSYRFGHSRFEYVRRPSGRLCLTIHDSISLYRYGNLRKNWKDTTKKQLEARLDAFLIALFKRASFYREKRLREEQEERQRLERIRLQELEAERLAKLKAQIEKEKAKVEKLFEDASKYSRSKQVRAFIAAIEADWKEGNRRYEIDGDFTAWLQWALEQADRLDPLSDSASSILDQDPGPDRE